MARFNAWKGFVLGSVGGVVGAVAMNYYWQFAAELTGEDPREAKLDKPIPPDLQEFVNLSLVGMNAREGESSTAAMGRIIYTTLMGKEPETEETKTLLSWITHYAISGATGGLYAMLRGKAREMDIPGGFLMGTSMWAFGDEMLMPLTGFAKGPVAYPPELHLHAWGAHLVYGVATALTTQFLEEVFSLEIEID